MVVVFRRVSFQKEEKEGTGEAVNSFDRVVPHHNKWASQGDSLGAGPLSRDTDHNRRSVGVVPPVGPFGRGLKDGSDVHPCQIS